MAEKLKDVLWSGEEIDVLSWLKEFGDSGWYLMEGCTALNESASDMATVVIGKLRDRYPEKFNETRAQNHNGQ